MYASIIKSSFLRRLYFERSEMEQLLLLSSLFSIALSFFRVVYTGELMFLFLIWNLFLAFVPYAITEYSRQQIKWIESGPKFSAVLLVWLLFVPNAFYIITDLFHLHARPEIPLWFDLALIFSFAWNGLLMGVLSVQQMEQLVSIKWPLKRSALFIIPTMFLISLGIYIGRYLRYNSWDVVQQPFGLIADLWLMIVNPVQNRFDWSMIICFTALTTFIYYSMKRGVKG